MTRASKNQATREEIRRFVRLLEVNDSNVVALKTGSIVANERAIKALSRAFAATGRGNIVIIVVDEFDDLSVLDEEQMKGLGWLRDPEFNPKAVKVKVRRHEESGN